ncbi:MULTISPECIES: hypothetical protein [unclassified Kitasatospora]|uniref:hypothetical protein n=1 Tax=unclassified Kitasatospora TaxID=2633591 RepID=UPI00070B1503|nr:MULTISPECIES: hypothetical protein [unclassified Kitasatospora]KQV05804.1 hypothetical protein ASC99_13105 [Kitasatospora sp. Root107]KRB62607.1 hypothetical protein ASE03_08065 [Kitasatospora sp. Root187]
MKLYLAIPIVLMALLLTASGAAAVTRGWILPMNRRHVRSPRLYGCGQLVAAFALCWQAVFGLMISGADGRPWGTLTGGVLLMVGLILMMAGQFRGSRQGNGTP